MSCAFYAPPMTREAFDELATFWTAVWLHLFIGAIAPWLPEEG